MALNFDLGHDLDLFMVIHFTSHISGLCGPIATNKFIDSTQGIN